MRAVESLVPGLAVVATGVALIAGIFIIPNFALARGGLTPPFQPQTTVSLDPFAETAGSAPSAGGDPQSAAPSCSCPESEHARRPKFAGLIAGPTSALDDNDELAALASVNLALNGVADGQAYVWARANGRLSGLVRPVSSFRNDEGQICRHLIVLLTTGLSTKKTEGTACRLQGGRWEIGG